MGQIQDIDTVHAIIQAKSNQIPDEYRMALSTVDFAALVNALAHYYDSPTPCQHDDTPCLLLLDKPGFLPCAQYVYQDGLRELAGGLLSKIADSVGVRYDYA